LFNPFSGKVLEHLLMSGFMDGHTQWMGEDGNEDEVHEGSSSSNEGQEDDIDEEHDDADEDHDQEEHVYDEDMRTPLTSAMHDLIFKNCLLGR
jgi:hypothetical protein